LEGKKAFRARCRRTLESLPIEYIMTGRSKLAATSRMISMLSDSRALRWVSDFGEVVIGGRFRQEFQLRDTPSSSKRQGRDPYQKMIRNAGLRVMDKGSAQVARRAFRAGTSATIGLSEGKLFHGQTGACLAATGFAAGG
jgi:hypothetical protein